MSDNGIGALGGAALGDMVQLGGLKQACEMRRETECFFGQRTARLSHQADFSWNCVCVAGARAIAEGLKKVLSVSTQIVYTRGYLARRSFTHGQGCIPV